MASQYGGGKLSRMFKSSFLYKTIDSVSIFQIFILVIIAAKIVRWTLMYGNQVMNGIGHFWLSDIYNGNVGFELFSADEGASSAGGNAAYIFWRINIFHVYSYIDWEIYVSVLANVIVLLVMTQLKQVLRIYQWLLVTMTVAILNIFSFCLSKDPIQMCYFVLIFLILITNWNYKYKCLGIYACILFSCMTFRTYYILVLMFMIATQVGCNWILKRIKGTGKRVMAFVVGITIFCFIFLNWAYIFSPENYQGIYDARVNTRSIETANTGITNWLPTDTVLMFTLNWITVVFRLLLPLELVPMGPKYWLFVIYQIFVTIFVLKAIKSLNKNSKTINLALFVYFGFLLGSAMFEPDFGSWVRHESVCFPVLFVMSDIIGVKKTHSMKYVGENSRKRIRYE